MILPKSILLKLELRPTDSHFRVPSLLLLQRLMLDSAARAIAYSPSGKHLAVGLGRGKKSDKSDGG